MGNFKEQNVAELVKSAGPSMTIHDLRRPPTPRHSQEAPLNRQIFHQILEKRLLNSYCLSIRKKEQDDVAIFVVVVCG